MADDYEAKDDVNYVSDEHRESKPKLNQLLTKRIKLTWQQIEVTSKVESEHPVI